MGERRTGVGTLAFCLSICNKRRDLGRSLVTNGREHISHAQALRELHTIIGGIDSRCAAAIGGLRSHAGVCARPEAISGCLDLVAAIFAIILFARSRVFYLHVVASFTWAFRSVILFVTAASTSALV